MDCAAGTRSGGAGRKPGNPVIRRTPRAHLQLGSLRRAELGPGEQPDEFNGPVICDRRRNFGEGQKPAL